MDLSRVSLSWVQNAYLLCFGGFLLLAARVGDTFGRKKTLLGGLTLFSLSSLIIGIAPNAEILIAGRALQGIGASTLATSVLALIAANFAEGQERTRALSAYSMVAGSGASLGLVVGGLFVDQISWRVGFLINVPIGIVLVAAGARLLSETETKRGTFDIFGAISSLISMSLLVFAIVNSAEAGWSDPATLVSLVVSAVTLIAFIYNETKAAQPVMPLRLFASAERSGAYVARALFMGTMVAMFFFVSQFLQEVRGFTAFHAGFGFLPMTISIFAVALATPRLTRLVGNANVAAGGLALLTIGMAWLSRATVDSNLLFSVALPLVVIGVGNGAALSTLTVAGVAGVDKADQGAASGVVNVFHQIGGSLGLGILVVVFAAAHSDAGTAQLQLAERISMAHSAAALMLAIAFIIVLVFVIPGARARARVAAQPAAAE